MTHTGINNISASFMENNKYAASNSSTTVDVLKLATTITLNPIGTINQNNNFTITGKIVDEKQNPVKGTIKLLINWGRATIYSMSNGQFTFTYNATHSGENRVIATYLESTNYLSSFSTIPYTVIKA